MSDDGSLIGMDRSESAAFAQLQGVCSRIMLVARERSTRDEYVACVRELRDILQGLDAPDVHVHRQYVLLPLCVILDAKVAVQWHDASLCGTLSCLSVLASRCRLDEHEGPPLIQRMLAMLGDAEASYSAEARRIMAEILAAVFESSNGTSDQETHARPARPHYYLSKEHLRPIVGNALSVLLNHPCNDVTKPSSIVPANQMASIMALSKLIQAAGRQQMAFFVPGIATGLVKRLIMHTATNLEGDVVTSKRDTGGIVVLLRGLEVLVVVTLCDDAEDANEDVGSKDEDSAVALNYEDGWREDNATSYIAQLRDLSSLEPKGAARQPKSDDELQTLEASIRQDKNTLWVEASPDWARATAIRIAELLRMCLPKLCLHQNVAVRSQVVHLASGVVDVCQVAFEGQDGVLVDSLLLLAQDEWPSVRSSAGKFLSTRLSPRHRECLEARLLGTQTEEGDSAGAPHPTTTSLLSLPIVLKSRPEQQARQEAARLCSIIEYCRSPGKLSEVGSGGTTWDEAVLDALVSCFEVEASAAVVIASTPLIAAQTTMEPSSSGADAAMPVMPVALRYMTTKATYDIFARLVRCLAKEALWNDLHHPSSTEFSGLVALCARELCRLWSADKAETDARLRAAAIMTIVSEVFAGAALVIEDMEDPGGDLQATENALSISKMAALDILYAIQDGGIWLLRSNPVGPSGVPQRTGDKSTELQAANAIILQRCMVFVSIAARCLKAAFVEDGSCTVTFLVPVIERYSSDSQYVSAAAKDAIHSICTFCGYPGGLRDLITRNIDYVIDGMCIRLRQPSIYPDAPKLFAALLRENGVALALVPLLTDPAQHMIRGVSILQRRERPENVLAFVMCTQEIALGLVQVSLQGLEMLQKVNSRSFEEKGGVAGQGECVHECDDVVKPDKDTDDADECKEAAPTSIEEISGYFRERRAGKVMDVDQNASKIVVTREVWDAAYLARGRLDAAARLSQSIADSLAPLSASKSLAVAVQSFTATTRALESLKNAHQGLELFKNCIEEHLECEGQTPPPSGGKQAPPAFLPSVHICWTPLVGSLKDWRVPVVEASIEALQALLVLAPDFLSKRFRTEAWPILRSLMKEGMPVASKALAATSAGTPSVTSAPFSRDAGSPALMSRIRRAVAGLFTNIVDILDETEAENLLQPIARQLLHDVVVHACESDDDTVADAMRVAFERISTVHPDSAWATLYTYAVTSGRCTGSERGDQDTTIGWLGVAPGLTSNLAPFQDFRQWSDTLWWVSNQLQSLMI